MITLEKDTMKHVDSEMKYFTKENQPWFIKCHNARNQLCTLPLYNFYGNGAKVVCSVYLAESVYRKTIFLSQMLSKITQTEYLSKLANGQLEILYSEPQGGTRWGVSQEEQQSPVTARRDQLHPFTPVGHRNIAFAASQGARDWENMGQGPEMEEMQITK